MFYDIETTNGKMSVEAAEFELIGIAAGSPGFFCFRKDNHAILTIAAKSVVTIEQVSRMEKKG